MNLRLEIVVLNAGVNTQAVFDYYKRCLSKNSRTFRFIRHEGEVESTIGSIKRFNRLTKREEKEIVYNDKKIKIIKLKAC